MGLEALRIVQNRLHRPADRIAQGPGGQVLLPSRQFLTNRAGKCQVRPALDADLHNIADLGLLKGKCAEVLAGHRQYDHLVADN